MQGTMPGTIPAPVSTLEVSHQKYGVTSALGSLEREPGEVKAKLMDFIFAFSVC